MINDKKGFENMPCANVNQKVGPQGPGGPMPGQEVMAVSNPHAITAKVIGNGVSIVQMPVTPKVGK
jgi:hypothetical protein